MRKTKTMSRVEASAGHFLSYETKIRMLDIFFSIVLLVVTSPFLVSGCVWVKIFSPGPILYTQWRVGKDGKKFLILKLRTMKVGCRGSLDTTTKDDPRYFFGSWFLRVTHIDELFQLFNVLMGDMSLVGPRPRLEKVDTEWVEVVGPSYLERRRVLPGLTSAATICGRSATDAEKIEASRLELEHIEKPSVKAYLKILFLTVPHVMPVRKFKFSAQG